MAHGIGFLSLVKELDFILVPGSSPSLAPDMMDIWEVDQMGELFGLLPLKHILSVYFGAK